MMTEQRYRTMIATAHASFQLQKRTCLRAICDPRQRNTIRAYPHISTATGKRIMAMMSGTFSTPA